MKLSISNIAWNKQDDKIVYRLLQENHIYGLDIAPARIFDKPFEITKEQGQQFKEELKEYGLTPVGMQSLLFGTTGLALFEDEETRKQTIDHLKKMMDYAQKIGITKLVFGSPKNRLINNLPKEKIEQLSYDIFNELGDYATSKNVYFCIEPNPIAYGADFITNTKEGIELVKQVNNPGFRLHMDLGTMIMNHENMKELVKEGLSVTEHIHLSHPHLEPVIGFKEVHQKFSKILKENGYNKVVSIEMKNTTIDKIKESIEFINLNYKIK